MKKNSVAAIILENVLKSPCGTRLEPLNGMKFHQNVKLFGFPLPVWMHDALRTTGLLIALKFVFRYTFAGEYFDRLYREAAGEAPIEEFPA
jgi:hypothetical protein